MLLEEKINNNFLELLHTPDFKKSYGGYHDELEKVASEFSSSPLPSLFHPIVISKDKFPILKEHAETMAKILDTVVKLYLAHQPVRQFFNFPPTLEEWIKIAPGYDINIPVSRYDGFWSNGNYKFCEFNTDGSAGMDEASTIAEAFLKTSVGKKLNKKHSLKHFELRRSILDILLECYRQFNPNKVPNIAIVDFMESATKAEFLSLKKFFCEQNFKTQICDIRNLKLKKNGLWCNDFKIDLIYRRAVTDEVLEKKDEIKDFIKAYKARAVCVVGPLKSHIVHSKLILAFLNSEISNNFFSKEEISFIKKHIPWTGLLRNEIDLITKLLKNKDKYFLKPHNMYGSRGVYAGINFSDDQWERIINSLLEKDENNYLVQKRIFIPKEKFYTLQKNKTEDFYTNLGPYIFNKKFKGFYSRISKNIVVSTYNDAFIVPLFIAQK
jgi:glutathionylspermidine synthase